MEGDRTPDHLVMLLAFPIGPGLIDGDFFLKRHMGHFGGEPSDGLRLDPATLGHGIRANSPLLLSPGASTTK